MPQLTSSADQWRCPARTCSSWRASHHPALRWMCSSRLRPTSDTLFPPPLAGSHTAGVEGTSHGEVGGAGAFAFDAGDLEDGRQVLQLGMAEQGPQRSPADGSLAEVL